MRQEVSFAHADSAFNNQRVETRIDRIDEMMRTLKRQAVGLKIIKWMFESGCIGRGVDGKWLCGLHHSEQWAHRHRRLWNIGLSGFNILFEHLKFKT